MSVTAYHFWSPTCQPCKHIKPAVEDLKEDFSQVTWVSVNTHADPDNYAEKYNVRTVPTIVVVSKHGIDRHSGTQMMGYYTILKRAIRA